MNKWAPETASQKKRNNKPKKALTNQVIGIKHCATQWLIEVRHLESNIQLQAIRQHSLGHSEVVALHRNIIIGKLVRRSVQRVCNGAGGGGKGEI